MGEVVGVDAVAAAGGGGGGVFSLVVVLGVLLAIDVLVSGGLRAFLAIVRLGTSLLLALGLSLHCQQTSPEVRRRHRVNVLVG